MPEKISWRRKNIARSQKGCSEYIQGDSLKLPPKNSKCLFVKNIVRSQKAASRTLHLFLKGQAALMKMLFNLKS